MTGAMYAAISGLKSHMSKLNVIGNNIANVNTYGYKTARMTFRESMYTTVTAGSDGGENTGGINPSQVGYGATVGSIDLNMSTATYAPTGVDMDCMIDGEGFFMVGDKNMDLNDPEDLTKLDLTRVGDFFVDANGYVCDGAGRVVYGFATVQNPDYTAGLTEADYAADPNKAKKTIVSTQLTALRLPLAAANPEDNGGVNGATRYWEEGDAVFSVLGAEDEDTGVRLNQSPMGLQYGANGVGDGATLTTMAVANAEGACIQLESINIDATGKISGINKATKATVVVGYIGIASVDNPSGVTHLDGPYYKAQGGAGNVRVAVLGGVMEGKYLNNKHMADGDDVVKTTAEAILSGGTTEIRSGGLEASSTDIANEFSEMITTQRGYQANTRIVTVTDSMLEELVNMKR